MIVGIFCNGGAAMVLGVAALSASWAAWGTLARLHTWFSLFAVTMITLELFLARARYQPAA